MSSRSPSENSEDFGEDHGDASSSSNEAGPSSRAIDGPRVAQWEDDEEFEAEARPIKPSKEKKKTASIQDDLSSLPYAALLKARRTLANTATASESFSGSEDEDGSEISNKDDPQEGGPPSKQAIQKRSNKHAPIEMSSKRAVTRRRVVVDVKKTQHRDPRFMSGTDDMSVQKFHANYAFLSKMHSNELSTLRENLKRAKKLLRSSPRDVREEREEEVQRLEDAVKRAESSVNRDKQEQINRRALDKVNQEEKERRKQGKSEWYLKSAEKKKLLIQARHDAIAESGGTGAVKKAIEKRQKKINQKEKKSRPWNASGDGGGPSAGAGAGRKRPRDVQMVGSNKRPRH